MTSVRTLSIAVAALLMLAATDTAAQDQRPIRAREAAAVQAADVYELVEKLRPEWLWMGGDPRFAASRAKVRVWVDDTQAGGLEALRGLTMQNVYSVRLVGRQVARGRDPRLDPEVVGAVLVRYEHDPNPPPRRFQVTAGIGYRSLLEPRARQSMIDAGLDSLSTHHLWRRSIQRPITQSASVAMNLRHGIGVSASVLHTGTHNVRSISLTPPFAAISNEFQTSDLALGVFATRHSLRLGAGPALRVLRYEQMLGTCECEQPEGGTTLVPGAASDVELSIPPAGRIYMRLAFAGGFRRTSCRPTGERRTWSWAALRRTSRSAAASAFKAAGARAPGRTWMAVAAAAAVLSARDPGLSRFPALTT